MSGRRLVLRPEFPFVELDWHDAKKSRPARLVAECVIEGGEGVLPPEEDVNRL